ncbi:hypothetical protein IFM89_020998 [Coptis chinensis]|uniref:Protein cornichon homolog 1 n=1 Tax=Coptis chinensis TaxID=261450 RepID=A0A835LI17_9MAGN|nr:hypothetical protein IFM89_020998 [Coptis chinensis]
MEWELTIWIFNFLCVIALLVLNGFQFICLSDLESDQSNPYDTASHVNACVIPEFVIQGTLCVIFLLMGHWVLLLLSVPLTLYHIRLYRGRKHLIDVTEIYRSLNEDKRDRLVKFGFYAVLFFNCLIRIIQAAVEQFEEGSSFESGLF